MPEATALDIVLGKVHQYILSVVPHPVVRTTLSLWHHPLRCFEPSLYDMLHKPEFEFSHEEQIP